MKALYYTIIRFILGSNTRCRYCGNKEPVGRLSMEFHTEEGICFPCYLAREGNKQFQHWATTSHWPIENKNFERGCPCLGTPLQKECASVWCAVCREAENL